MKSTKKKSSIVKSFIDDIVEDLNDGDTSAPFALEREDAIVTQSVLDPLSLEKDANKKRGRAPVLLVNDGAGGDEPPSESETLTKIPNIDLNPVGASNEEDVPVFGFDTTPRPGASLNIFSIPELDEKDAALPPTQNEGNEEKNIFTHSSSTQISKSTPPSQPQLSPQPPNSQASAEAVEATEAMNDATVPLKMDYPTHSQMDRTLPPGSIAKRTQNTEFDRTRPPTQFDIRPSTGGSTMDRDFSQAENLRIAQQRIFELEQENDKLRAENDELANAADVVKNRNQALSAQIAELEKEVEEVRDSGKNEALVLKGNLQFKDSENAKLKMKIEELDARLRTDFRRIRVRERELENRLELLRAEKLALVRAKDENILELKRKLDTLQSEIESYRSKLLELNQIIDTNQDQFKRTVKALRLALSSLEIKDENIVPLKKHG